MTTERLTAYVSHLDCETEAASIQRGLKGEPGVVEVTVYAKAGKVDLTFAPDVTNRPALLVRLAALGFPARRDPAADAPAPVKFLNLGGGFGIPYFPGDEQLDLKAVGQALGEALEAVPQVLKYTQFCVELGRYLVGEAGVYLTRIVDRKASHGEVFLVVDGGLHHQLAASGNFGTVVRRNYPVAIATRFDAAPTEEASVVGCLCTPLDRLAEKAGFPKAQVGDLVAVFCAGAYGASASPAQFLGHGPALEMLI